jgi:hypothetical protein
MHTAFRCGRPLALPLVIGASIAAVAAPTAALAANPCYPHESIVALLAERYGEHPVGAGVASDHLVELLIRPDGASWTILVIRPDGIACPVAAGENWTGMAAPAPSESGS